MFHSSGAAVWNALSSIVLRFDLGVNRRLVLVDQSCLEMEQGVKSSERVWVISMNALIGKQTDFALDAF